MEIKIKIVYLKSNSFIASIDIKVNYLYPSWNENKTNLIRFVNLLEVKYKRNKNMIALNIVM